jgi:RNA polymerase sigma-70 factor (ECF subfamily)
MIDETIFIKCLKANCPLAWKALHLRNDKMIFDLAIKTTGNFQDAEEVSGNVYRKFFEGIEDFRSESSISTYLHKVAVNEALDFVISRDCRKNKTIDQPREVDENGDAIEADVRVTVTNPESIMEDKQTSEAINRAIDNLPPKEKIAFNLKVKDGKSYEEICCIMNTTINKAKKFVQHAKEKLRIALKHFNIKFK